uniref:Acyl-CoA dehydrogenase n=1 Tax=Thermofilum pendens TaxID=2269 RepID=A0A7J3X7C6_THEPE
MWRTDTFSLLPTPEQEAFLRNVGDVATKLINMENYRRRGLFFEGGGIDKSWRSAWERRCAEYREICRTLGSANFHEVCRAAAEQ